jgi:hypothetical protein
VDSSGTSLRHQNRHTSKPWCPQETSGPSEPVPGNITAPWPQTSAGDVWLWYQLWGFKVPSRFGFSGFKCPACLANSFRVTRPAMVSAKALVCYISLFSPWVCGQIFVGGGLATNQSLSHPHSRPITIFAGWTRMCVFPFLACHGSNSGRTYHDYVAKSSQTNMC